MLTLCSNLEVAERCDVGGNEVDDDREPEEPITSPSDSITVSDLVDCQQLKRTGARSAGRSAACMTSFQLPARAT
jgi:hypothetical protein